MHMTHIYKRIYTYINVSSRAIHPPERSRCRRELSSRDAGVPRKGKSMTSYGAQERARGGSCTEASSHPRWGVAAARSALRARGLRLGGEIRVEVGQRPRADGDDERTPSALESEPVAAPAVKSQSSERSKTEATTFTAAENPFVSRASRISHRAV